MEGGEGNHQASTEGGGNPNPHCLPQRNFCQLDLAFGFVWLVGWLVCLCVELRWRGFIVWFMSVGEPTWLFLDKDLNVVGQGPNCCWTRTWLFLTTTWLFLDDYLVVWESPSNWALPAAPTSHCVAVKQSVTSVEQKQLKISILRGCLKSEMI